MRYVLLQLLCLLCDFLLWFSTSSMQTPSFSLTSVCLPALLFNTHAHCCIHAQAMMTSCPTWGRDQEELQGRACCQVWESRSRSSPCS